MIKTDRNFELLNSGVAIGKCNYLNNNYISKELLEITNGSRDMSRALAFIESLCEAAKLPIPHILITNQADIEWKDILIMLLGINNGLLGQY